MSSSSTVLNMIHFSGKMLVSFNASQFPLKLTPQNYPTWHAQLVPVFRGHNLMGYIDRTPPCPSPIVQQKDGKDVSTCPSPADKIQVSCANHFAIRILSLREKLTNFKRESKPVSEYLHDIKIMTEDLALCGSPVFDINLVIYVLHGVGTEFRDIAAAVCARDSVISFEEL
ncbi:uncharacterized protein LOC122721485 [Manihot esculenta]|uniref:uncharacterized protein LOC122721485 n=1 Tax=Manihot esculenta TaxID=3983 RepID=UPI001CC524A3|nr:uncharacterized protein LOC122721485 [Manihot esculenta]